MILASKPEYMLKFANSTAKSFETLLKNSKERENSIGSGIVTVNDFMQRKSQLESEIHVPLDSHQRITSINSFTID